jgi:DNA-binding Xre family transcriptional regulator
MGNRRSQLRLPKEIKRKNNYPAPVNVTSQEAKADIADGFDRVMRKRKCTQSHLAREMHTSRAVVHRLLKREDASVTLRTIARASDVLECTVKIRLTPNPALEAANAKALQAA